MLGLSWQDGTINDYCINILVDPSSFSPALALACCGYSAGGALHWASLNSSPVGHRTSELPCWARGGWMQRLKVHITLMHVCCRHLVLLWTLNNSWNEPPCTLGQWMERGTDPKCPSQSCYLWWGKKNLPQVWRVQKGRKSLRGSVQAAVAQLCHTSAHCKVPQKGPSYANPLLNTLSILHSVK